MEPEEARQLFRLIRGGGHPTESLPMCEVVTDRTSPTNDEVRERALKNLEDVAAEGLREFEDLLSRGGGTVVMATPTERSSEAILRRVTNALSGIGAQLVVAGAYTRKTWIQRGGPWLRETAKAVTDKFGGDPEELVRNVFETSTEVAEQMMAQARRELSKPPKGPPLTELELMALLDEPNGAWEMWDLVHGKYLDTLDSYKGERALREEAEYLGMASPFDYLYKFQWVADWKAALLLLHNLNPDLDMGRLAETDDLVVAAAVLRMLRDLKVKRP